MKAGHGGRGRRRVERIAGLSVGLLVNRSIRRVRDQSDRAIDFAAMSKGDHMQLIPRDTELIDHPKIANPQTKFRTPLQTVMGKFRQAAPEFPYPFFEAILRGPG